MKLYHGSKAIIDKPICGGSTVNNDYGPSFYLTRDFDSASEWACRNNSVGYVNEYQFNIDGLKILDLTDKNKYSVLNWVAILLHFRSLDNSFINSFQHRLNFLEKNYYIDVNDYDVVIGYRADDAYFRFPLDFIRGNITLEQLNYSFMLGKLGIQYALISERAISRLKFVEASLASNKFINKYFERVKSSTDSFNALNKDEEGTRIFDVMNGEKK